MTNHEYDPVEVRGTWGTFLVDPVSGVVVEQAHENTAYNDIQMVNLIEWRNFWGPRPLPQSIDILDLGYWLRSGAYCEPDHTWRQEIAFKTLGRYPP